jgi:hypothetical protein
MIWNEILLDRMASAPELRRAIRAAGLARSDAAVNVVDSMETVDRPHGVSVVCELTVRGGKFPLQISVYLYEDAPGDAVATLAKFVQSVGCRCLVPAESEDPYQMLLLAPGKSPELVDLDVAALDEREEYLLSK